MILAPQNYFHYSVSFRLSLSLSLSLSYLSRLSLFLSPCSHAFSNLDPNQMGGLAHRNVVVASSGGASSGAAGLQLDEERVEELVEWYQTLVLFKNKN